MSTPLKDAVIQIVNRIPYGQVCYFGQITEVLATEFNMFIRAQVAGWIMSGMKTDEYDLCPWHRVVVKNGFVASLKLGVKGILQIELLRSEGVIIVDNLVDMSKYCVQTDKLLHTEPRKK